MSVFARLRALLALSVLVIGGSVWLFAGQQRDAVIGMQGKLRASSDLLTAMLDQETGVRGYALTGEKSFLEPYVTGQGSFERALHDRQRTLSGFCRHRRRDVALVDHRRGVRAISLDDARTRKALMESFRTQDIALREHLEHRAQDELQHARWVAFGFVMVFSATVLSFGLLALERQARRNRARSRERREYVEALQGADHDGEAKELLRRRAERLAPGADAVVLTRNASGNSLDAATDPAAIPGLTDALLHATPRTCLAIRRGKTHQRKPDSTPLQRCELCDRVDGGSLCVPELVAGEVIGSLLVIKNGHIKAAERDTITGAVAQAAPILANLRNLAIAEHRAATDPLTKLPNARSVQEALIRMVAQSTRTGSPVRSACASASRPSRPRRVSTRHAATASPSPAASTRRRSATLRRR